MKHIGRERGRTRRSECAGGLSSVFHGWRVQNWTNSPRHSLRPVRWRNRDSNRTSQAASSRPLRRSCRARRPTPQPTPRLDSGRTNPTPARHRGGTTAFALRAVVIRAVHAEVAEQHREPLVAPSLETSRCRARRATQARTPVPSFPLPKGGLDGLRADPVNDVADGELVVAEDGFVSGPGEGLDEIADVVCGGIADRGFQFVGFDFLFGGQFGTGARFTP
jgi:hypothetical protein